MRLNSWLVNLCRPFNPTFNTSVRRARRITATGSASIESLESRRLLSGQTITVNVSGDTNIAGHTTLRNAIAIADSDAGGDTIIFAANLTGTITLTQGPLPITNSMTLTGPGSGVFTISGGATTRLFNVTSSVSSPVTISGLKLTQGNCSTSSFNAGLGGAIYSSGGLTLSNDVITSNTANDGGAVFNTGTLTTTNDVFSANSASNYGGGIYNTGTLTSSIDTFTGDSAANGGGIENLGTLSILNDTFTANLVTAQGGGIDNEFIAISKGTTFSANSAVNQQAGGAGAGIYNDDLLASTNDTFFNNTAWNGGGIYNLNAILITTNDTVASNTGKGIVVEDTTWNSLNSIVAGNTLGPGLNTASDVITSGSTINASHTLIGDANSAGGITNGANGNIVGSALNAIFDTNGQGNPVLANHGGPTQTLDLFATGPAVGAAGSMTTSTASVAMSNSVTTIAVANSVFFSAGDLVRIDHELMLVTLVPDATHINVSRAQDGTAAAPHLASTPIFLASDATGAIRVRYDLGALAKINHAPVGTPGTVSAAENIPYTLKTADFGFTDPYDTLPNTLLAIEFTTVPTAGTLKDNGTSVTAGQFVNAADISNGLLVFTPKTNLDGGPYFLCQFQVEDNGGTANGGQNLDQTARVLDVNIAHVNHAPVGTSGTITVGENTTYTVKTTDFGFTDTNDPSPNSLLAVKFTTLPNAGALTDNGVALTTGQFVSASDISGGKLVFTPKANLLGGPYFVCQFQVEDNGGTANGGVNLDPNPKVLDANIVDVNHAPIGTSSTITAVQNTPVKLTAANFGFTDPNDSPSNTLLAVMITTPPTFGTLTDNGVSVTAGQLVSLADIGAGKLVYTPKSNVVGGPFFLCQFQVEDNGGTANGGVNLDPNPKVLDVRIIP